MIVETNTPNMLPIQTVTFISLSSIIDNAPEIDAMVEAYLNNYSFGDTPHTLIRRQQFISIVGEMCNDDVIAEDVFNRVYDSLEDHDLNTFIDLET